MIRSAAETLKAIGDLDILVRLGVTFIFYRGNAKKTGDKYRLWCAFSGFFAFKI